MDGILVFIFVLFGLYVLVAIITSICSNFAKKKIREQDAIIRKIFKEIEKSFNMKEQYRKNVLEKFEVFDKNVFLCIAEMFRYCDEMNNNKNLSNKEKESRIEVYEKEFNIKLDKIQKKFNKTKKDEMQKIWDDYNNILAKEETHLAELNKKLDNEMSIMKDKLDSLETIGSFMRFLTFMAAASTMDSEEFVNANKTIMYYESLKDLKDNNKK